MRWMPVTRLGLYAIVTLVVALTLGCESTTTHLPTPEATVASSATGVKGVTVVDEGCPVLPIESQCPQRPLPARVLVLDQKGVEVTRANTDRNGQFQIELSPGDYILQGQNLTGAPLPSAMPLPVEVQKGRMQVVTIQFESGVRGPASLTES
jgi:hypothetical protein